MTGYRTSLVTAPSVEPLLLTEAKLHLRVDHTSDDSLITRLISAARHFAEKRTSRKFITQTWDISFDSFLSTRNIDVPAAPLQSVTSIKYNDVNSVEQTLDASKYTVDTSGVDEGRIALKTDETWPDTDDEINSVSVRIVAGYGNSGSDVPEDILSAMLLMIGHWYENRQEVVVGVSTTMVPLAALALLDSYRITRFD